MKAKFYIPTTDSNFQEITVEGTDIDDCIEQVEEQLDEMDELVYVSGYGYNIIEEEDDEEG